MALSTHTGIPVLVFNPAIHSRSIEIDGLGSGTEKLKGLVVLGKKDDVIVPDLTLQMLKGDWNDLEIVVEKNMGHRVPLEIFVDMYNKMSSNEQTE